MSLKSTGFAFIILSLLCVGVPALAGIHIEPYGAFVTGTRAGESTLRIEATPPVDKDFKEDFIMTGSVYGGKLGFSFGPLSVGGDYMAGQISSYSSGMANMTNIGAFARLGLPFFSVSATYFFDSKVSDDPMREKGSGFKAGIGFSFLPFISLNIEYLGLTFKTADLDQPKASYTKFQDDVGAVLIGLSVPL